MTTARTVLTAAWLDLRAGLMQFTRFPLPPGPAPASGWAGRGAWAWPVAGAVVGATGAAALWLAGTLSLPPSLAAILGVAAMALATGALHEDGLADFADGIGGGQDRESRLRIMRDSRLGSYGALALLLVTLWRIAVLAALAGGGTDTPAAAAALVTVAASARWSAALLAGGLPPANPDGQSASAGRPSIRALVAGLLGCLILAWLLLPHTVWLLPVCCAIVVATAVGFVARRDIGGQTGDALGAAAQIAEAAGLAALLAASG